MTKTEKQDKVVLNLVHTNYKPSSTLKLSEPDKWPAAVRLFLFPRKLGMQQSFWFRVACFVALVSLSVPIFFKEDKAWVVEFFAQHQFAGARSGARCVPDFGERRDNLYGRLPVSMFSAIDFLFCPVD